MTIDAIAGQHFSSKLFAYELRQAMHASTPMTVTVDMGGWFQTLSLDYHGGPRYPHLERIPGTMDMLAEIMRPHAK